MLFPHSTLDPLEAARGGDVEAFGELVKMHQGWLRKFLRERVNDWATADDLAQDVFVTAFRKIRDFHPDAPVKPWLRGIALNHLRNFRRKKREDYIGGSMELDVLANHRIQAPEPAGPSIEALHDSLAEIDPDSRDLLEKRYLQGLSVRELSHQTGRGYSALTMRFHRIRQMLADGVRAKVQCSGGL